MNGKFIIIFLIVFLCNSCKGGLTTLSFEEPLIFAELVRAKQPLEYLIAHGPKFMQFKPN